MNRLKDQIAAMEAIVQKKDNEIKAIRAEARAEALREAADCTGCWLDDGKSHHGCLPCRRGDKPDLYKTIAAITQEPQK
jgi:hypothetical protein